MLRSDYDGHPLWETLRAIDDRINTIVEAHSAKDLPNIERIWVQEEYVRSFDSVAATRVAFFHAAMLDAVLTVWQQVLASLDQRISLGLDYSNYVQQAADQSETGLLQMAAWPRAYGRGGEVKQMHTLFEELLEAQRASIDALSRTHEDLRAEVAAFSNEVTQRRDEAISSVSTAQLALNELESQIESQRSIVEDSVADTARTIKRLEDDSGVNYESWKQERESAFTADFADLRTKIGFTLEKAKAEYVELLGAKEKYTKLVSAIAADEVAAKFESEASWGRVAGIALYIAGFVLLAGAAVPLILLITENAKDAAGGIDWTPIVIRLAVGALAGSAATVAIRLGGRFIASANSAKRMELELRAIGPFLANVADPAKVDDARIELVSKAFGKTYGDAQASGTKDREELIPVTTATQLLDLASRLAKLN